MKKLYFLLLSLLSVGLLAACASNDQTSTGQGTIQIEDANGTKNVAENPQRIVVLDYGAADTIRALGYQDRIVGIPLQTLPSYLEDLRKEKNITDVGNLKEVNLEKIAELEPDLIIASGRTESMIKDLDEIAPTLFFETDQKNYWGSVKKNIETLASIFGKESIKKADQRLSDIDQMVKRIQQLNKDRSETTLMLMLNEGSLSGIGVNGRYGFVYTALGFKPTSLEFQENQGGGSGGRGGNHGQELSFESIAQVNPDRILVVDRTLAIGGDDTKNSDVLENALVQGTKAAQNNRIITLTSDIWYLSGGGLESTALMFDELAKTVGPDTFHKGS